jgi:sortase A
VTDPIEGKNILTLQTCTLPDYSQRLIVQAELINTTTQS